VPPRRTASHRSLEVMDSLFIRGIVFIRARVGKTPREALIC